MSNRVFSIQSSMFGARAGAACFAAMLLFASSVSAQDANASTTTRVNVSTSTTNVRVAEPFSVKLIVSAPEGTQVTLPPVAEKLGEFDVLDHHDMADVPDAGGQRTWTRRLTLESIATGDLTVPAIEVQTRNGSTSQIVRSEPVPLHVASVLEARADPTKFRDIRSVVDLQVPQTRHSTAWVWWVGGSLGGLTLAAATLALVVRRKHWLTPAEWANQQLDNLKHSNALRRGDTEAATSELSAILRDYLQMQFEISAPTQTTRELLDTIKHRSLLSSEQVSRFQQLFDSTDLAKFAGLHMTVGELDAEIERARELVASFQCSFVSVQQGNGVSTAASPQTDN